MKRSDLFKDMLKRNHVSDLFSPLHYDEETEMYGLDDGAIGFGVEFTPQLGGDDEAMNKIKSLLNDFYPMDTVMQFMLWKSPDISQKISDIENTKRILGDSASDLALKANLKERVAFFENSVHKEIESVNHSRLCDIKGFIFVTFNNKNSKKPVKFDSKEVQRMREIKLSVVETLQSSLGLQTSNVWPEKLISMYRSFLTWDEDTSYSSFSNAEERELLLREYFTPPSYELEAGSNFVSLDSGKKIAKTFSVNSFPTETYPDMPSYYLGDILSGHSTIPDNVLFNCTIHFSDSERVKKEIEKKKFLADIQAESPLFKKNRDFKKISGDFETMYDSMSNGDKPLSVMFTVTVFSDNKDKAKEASTRLTQYFKTNRLGFDLVEDDFIAFPLFLNQLPFNCELKAARSLKRFRTMTSHHVSRLIPFQSDWKGSGTPVINLVSRTGQLMALDLFDSSLSRNAIVVGESGGGKSFFVNELINSYLQTGAQVWVIDAGRSYEKLCENFKGDFVQFGEDSNVSLNPFAILQLDDDESEEDRSDDILALTDVIIAMASFKNELTDFQRTGLEKVLTMDLNKYGKKYNMDFLIHSLGEHSDGRLRDLGDQLYPFSSQGSSGKWFTGSGHITFDADLTVLELDELSNKEHLQRVVLLQLISTIEQIVYQTKDRSRRKICIIDEAWALLSEGTSIQRFITSAYRKFRKYNGSIITITQSIGDMYSSASSKAIVNNSPFKFLLKMQASSVEEFKDKKQLPLKDYEYNLIKSLKTVNRKFSEIYCITAESGNGVGRLIVDRYHQLLYSTNADETKVLDAHQRAGMTVQDSIRQYMADHG